MRTAPRILNAVVGMLGVAMVALTLGAAIPHQHDGSVSEHHHRACRIYKIQDSLSAAPASSSASLILQTDAVPLLQPAPRPIESAAPADPFSSRAPPQLA